MSWRKSSRSASDAKCVEVAIGLRSTGVRDTKNRGGDALRFSSRAFGAFVAAVKSDR
ncbi:hypothetical protein GCM10022243_65520 [Saccharothrix violaceirubra]|uniref:DUF397 domain-containing protein n=1 Tax=Saccharothrix violaceirubra TaxID=413306 RepID=A0A7W7T9B8_9PSEU|nr:DUF397 domain-containing protein [Saccharothrix violaceirubra]MBB4968961.1 hypothetical protein [Saccharothrix violaceirubra]